MTLSYSLESEQPKLSSYFSHLASLSLSDSAVLDGVIK